MNKTLVGKLEKISTVDINKYRKKGDDINKYRKKGNEVILIIGN